MRTRKSIPFHKHTTTTTTTYAADPEATSYSHPLARLGRDLGIYSAARRRHQLSANGPHALWGFGVQIRAPSPYIMHPVFDAE